MFDRRLFFEVLEPSSITIGYTFDSDYWHHGYATESLRALLTILKDKYHFERVFAHVYNDNYRSIRLLKIWVLCNMKNLYLWEILDLN